MVWDHMGAVRFCLPRFYFRGLWTMEHDIIKTLKELIKQEGYSKFSRRSGVSRDSLYKSLSEQGNPTLSTLIKMANALDYNIIIVAKKNEQASEG